MIYRNPEIHYALNAMIYPIDSNGKFDFKHLTKVTGFKASKRLCEVERISCEVRPLDVLLGVSENEYLTFGGTPTGQFTVRGPVQTDRLFIRSERAGEVAVGTFFSVGDVEKFPELRTDYIREIVDYIPEDQLSSFGISSLKKTLK